MRTAHTSLPNGAGSPEVVAPRLVSLRQMAEYLGCSYWTARDYVLQGLVPTVDLPPLRAREGDRPRTTLRRVLVDRVDLDAFIDAQKGRALSMHGASRMEPANTRAKRATVPALCPAEGDPCAG